MNTRAILKKALRCCGAVALALSIGSSTQAALYTYSGPFTGGGVIPDNSIIGLTDAHTITGLAPVITDVILTVHISGSYVDDLTGYIRLGNLAGSPSVSLDPYLTVDNNNFSVDLTSFDTYNPNNTWTLFFADTSPGGENTLSSWSLDITAVPEPINVALGAFAAIFLISKIARSARLRK